MSSDIFNGSECAKANKTRNSSTHQSYIFDCIQYGDLDVRMRHEYSLLPRRCHHHHRRRENATNETNIVDLYSVKYNGSEFKLNQPKSKLF